MRTAFEQHAASLGMDVTLCAQPLDGVLLYSDCNTDYAWLAWQASRQQMALQAAERIQDGPAFRKAEGGMVEIGGRARVAVANAIRAMAEVKEQG